MKLTRRSFVGTIASAAAVAGVALPSSDAEAQLVYMPGDWHAAEFRKLVEVKAKIKQLYDASTVNEGGPFNSMKNSLNGLHFGFGVPVDQIKIVGAFRGLANLMCFDDSMWEKYKLGEFANVKDPKIAKPAERNVFYPKLGYTATEVNDPKSVYQDYGIEALLPRGLTLLSCHNATTFAARGIVKKQALTATVDDVVKDLQAHMLPGTISVPAMVAAIAVLQGDGGFSYIAG